MKNGELLQLARYCGAEYQLGPGDEPTVGGMMFLGEGYVEETYPALRKFADCLVAAERERCAKLCDSVKQEYNDSSSGDAAARKCANAIRLPNV